MSVIDAVNNTYFNTNAAGNNTQSIATALLAKLGVLVQSAGFIVDTPGFTDQYNTATFNAADPKDKRLNIKYFSTDRSEAVRANYTATKIMGRSSPIFMYADGDAVQYSITCYFLAEGLYGITTGVSDVVSNSGLDVFANNLTIQNDVLKPVRWLKSLVYPLAGSSRPPVSPIFVFGEAFAARVFINEVLVEYVYGIEISQGQPLAARVTVKMTQNTNNRLAYNQSDIVAGVDTSLSNASAKKQVLDYTSPLNTIETFKDMVGLTGGA